MQPDRPSAIKNYSSLNMQNNIINVTAIFLRLAEYVDNPIPTEDFDPPDHDVLQDDWDERVIYAVVNVDATR
jgi:hypothetical protein